MDENHRFKLGVIGCFNIQYAIKNDELFVLEVNPRGSRTFPFVAKSTGIPLARIAARLTMGDLLSELNIPKRQEEAVAVKAPVFPFIKLRGLDPAPGPEMKSTGEVMGSHKNAAAAYLKAEWPLKFQFQHTAGYTSLSRIVTRIR